VSRYARKVDDNHAELVRLWRNMGAVVLPLASVGDGVPDVLVGFRQKWTPVEIKNLAGRGRKLTPAQVLLHGEIKRAGLPLAIVTNEDEALAILGARRGA
jgi:hypothetical protein